MPKAPTRTTLIKIYKRSLKFAEDRRTLEINLLWQRSLVFWGFTLAAFTGFAYLLTLPNQSVIYEETLIIVSFGFFSAFLFTLANRGSKFWQEYWELKLEAIKKALATFGYDYKVFESIKKPNEKQRKDIEKQLKLHGFQLEVTEDDVMEHIKSKQFGWMRFSVSRLVTALSDYITFMWLLILIVNMDYIIKSPGYSLGFNIGSYALGFAAFTLLWACIVCYKASHGHYKKDAER